MLHPACQLKVCNQLGNWIMPVYSLWPRCCCRRCNSRDLRRLRIPGRSRSPALLRMDASEGAEECCIARATRERQLGTPAVHPHQRQRLTIQEARKLVSNEGPGAFISDCVNYNGAARRLLSNEIEYISPDEGRVVIVHTFWSSGS